MMRTSSRMPGWNSGTSARRPGAETRRSSGRRRSSRSCSRGRSRSRSQRRPTQHRQGHGRSRTRRGGASRAQERGRAFLTRRSAAAWPSSHDDGEYAGSGRDSRHRSSARRGSAVQGRGRADSRAESYAKDFQASDWWPARRATWPDDSRQRSRAALQTSRPSSGRRPECGQPRRFDEQRRAYPAAVDQFVRPNGHRAAYWTKGEDSFERAEDSTSVGTDAQSLASPCSPTSVEAERSAAAAVPGQRPRTVPAEATAVPADRRAVLGLPILLEELVAGGPRDYTDHAKAPTPFCGASVPRVTLAQFVQRVDKFFYCTTECFVLAYIYVKRSMQTERPLVITPWNVHRLYSACMLVATKYQDDIYYTNRYYAKVVGVTLEDINNMERSLLSHLDFKLFVRADEYNHCLEELARACTTDLPPSFL